MKETRGLEKWKWGENRNAHLTSLQTPSPPGARPHVKYMNHGLGTWPVRWNIKCELGTNNWGYVIDQAPDVDVR